MADLKVFCAKMKLLNFFSLLLLLTTNVAFGQLFTEDFESGSGSYSTTEPEDTDLGEDYFINTDGSDIGGGVALTGVSGNFFAAQDIDAIVGSSPQSLSWTGINIAGCAGFTFSIDLAEDDDGSNQDWDAGDYVHIFYSIDGGAEQNLLWIHNDGSTFNSAPFIDTDFDGVGDGAEITDAFTTFSAAIAGTGSLLDIRIEISLNSGDEDIAFDNLEVTGSCSSNTISTDAVSALTFNVDCGSGDNGTVDFSSVGTFNPGNTFSAELSDATGSFASPITIGTLADDGVDPTGTIPVTIPAGTASGTGYRIRVVSNDPNTVGTDNGVDIEVINTPCTITVTSISSLTYSVDCTTGDAGNIDFSATGSYNVGNIFTVELSNPTGSFASPTAIGTLNLNGTNPSGTISFTIPAGIAAGTAYRTRIVSSDPIVTGTDNGSDIEIISTPCPVPLPASGGLLINEFSNGSTGSQEFYEFIVAGQCGETVDIRNYIIDDNNGTFSNPMTYPGGSGIAQGHLRLTTHAQWSNIPVGSVIVIYNDADPNGSLPPDDPFDGNSDSLYVIPHNTTSLLEIETSIPNAFDPDSTYAPSTYAGTAWNPLGIANSGDAIQIRQPDGTYFHGVSYGNSDITGGPDNTKIFNGNMGGMNGLFNSGDFTDPANWSTGSAPADETPGTYNNAANEAWLRLMRDPSAATCPVNPLPVTLVIFGGAFENDAVELFWESASEQNNSHYQLYHSSTGYHYEEIANISGAGTISHTVHYSFSHRAFNSGINYYKLQSVDFDGTIHEKGIIAVMVDMEKVFYDPISSSILLPSKGDYAVYDVSGKLIKSSQNESSIFFDEKGIFVVVNSTTGYSTKIVIP